ncbi:MAG: amidohydrolase family protein [Coriobacteriia bacterium]|nr:amidohydrolase family protein [Coriobacteriia bacterium]MCL2750716.1 amidohydrolase family protein [Coriobacteriia bacterium]
MKKEPTLRVDIHNHVYPKTISHRAVEGVGRYYDVIMAGNGTVDELLSLQSQAGIDYSVVHSVALRPEQVTTINDFIAEQCREHPTFIGFAAMHQDFEDKAGEIERALSLGLCGFKMHPDSQCVNIDDERLMEFYALLEGRLPVMLHCGDYRHDYSHPIRTKRVLQEFPNLTVNCAHFGGWSLYDLAVEYLEDEHCFMDISSASVYLGPRRTTELIRHYGAERILFGSDYPMWNPVLEIERFLLNNLTSAEQEQVLWRSAEAYLGREFSV